MDGTWDASGESVERKALIDVSVEVGDLHGSSVAFSPSSTPARLPATAIKPGIFSKKLTMASLRLAFTSSALRARSSMRVWRSQP